MAKTLATVFTDAQANRVAIAVGRRLNLRDAGGARRSATPAEVADYDIAQWRLLVTEEEAAARREADVPAAPIAPNSTLT